MRYAIKKDLRNEREHHHTNTKGHVNEKAAAATHTAQTETTLRTSTRYTIKQHTRKLQHAHTHTHTHTYTRCAGSPTNVQLLQNRKTIGRPDSDEEDCLRVRAREERGR